MVFAFVMLNAIFVLVIFLLQLNQDQLHFQWPLGQKISIVYDDETNTVSFPGYSLKNIDFSTDVVLTFSIVNQLIQDLMANAVIKLDYSISHYRSLISYEPFFCCLCICHEVIQYLIYNFQTVKSSRRYTITKGA